MYDIDELNQRPYRSYVRAPVYVGGPIMQGLIFLDEDVYPERRACDRQFHL